MLGSLLQRPDLKGPEVVQITVGMVLRLERVENM